MTTFVWLTGSVMIGIIAAWLASRSRRGNGFGFVGNMIAGVLGAVAGGYALQLAGVDLGGGVTGRLVVAAIGAAIVLFLVHLFTGPRAGHRSWS